MLVISVMNVRLQEGKHGIMVINSMNFLSMQIYIGCTYYRLKIGIHGVVMDIEMLIDILF